MSWKDVGKWALRAAPIAAAPFTGGLSLAALGAGSGFAEGLISGKGVKGSLLNAGMNAIPIPGVGGGVTGLAKGAVRPALGAGLKQAGKTALKTFGTQAAGNVLSRAGGGGGGEGNVYNDFGMGFAPTQQRGSFGGFLPRNAGGPGLPGGGPSPTYPGGPVGSPAPGGRVANGTIPGVPTAPGTAPPGPDSQTAGGAGFWEKYGPLIAQGGGLAIGGWAGKKATEMAAKRSPEEQAALTGANEVAGQARGLAGELVGQGKQYLQQPANYYQTLLSGNRAAMSGMVAPAVAQITGNYRGAGRALEHSGLRGAARENATADLNRQRVSQIAGLTTGVQGNAADKLAGLGTDMLSQAPGLIGTAGNIYGNLLGQGTANRIYSRGEGERTAGAIGGLARDVGEVVFRKGQPPVPDKPRAPAPGQPTAPGGTAPAPAKPGLPQVPAWNPAPTTTARPAVQPRLPRRPFGNGDYGGGSWQF